jgi:hypothetical protein
MEPLLSIIIPTKNRYEYLKIILGILQKIKDDGVEFVIQDNSDEDTIHSSFSDYIAGLHDNRVKYFYNSCYLSINENSDRAVKNSIGRYVTFIGDDDCVSAHIVQAAMWMEKETIDVLTFHCPSYIWPDVEYKYLSKEHTGVLIYEKPTGKVEIKNPLKELDRLLKKGGQYLKEMPQLYHGIASRTVLDNFYKITGSYFPGSVPDMDVAICLSLSSTKYYRINIPIVISGTAKKSAGGLGAAKMHKGDLTKITMLPKDTVSTWNQSVPFFWSGPTIYADSVHKCLARTGNQDMLERFNYNYLYAMLLVFNSDFIKETFEAMGKNKNTSKLKILYYVMTLFLLRSYFFIRNRLPTIFIGNNHKIRISTINGAVDFLEQIIEKTTLPWEINY